MPPKSTFPVTALLGKGGVVAAITCRAMRSDSLSQLCLICKMVVGMLFVCFDLQFSMCRQGW